MNCEILVHHILLVIIGYGNFHGVVFTNSEKFAKS